jgi:predicted TIM-barrel fold metal-dependent hydrolase
MDRVTVVSADGHSSVPPELWEEYLEPEYHEWLPRLREEHLLYRKAMLPLNRMVFADRGQERYDSDGAFADERWRGLWDRDLRLAEMDREGIAAEIVYFGDYRTMDLFHNVMNAVYPPDVLDAGARAYDRWVFDTFGASDDRLLLSGGIGGCADVDALVAELDWVADHGFVGTYAPGFNGVPGVPPLDDGYWDPVWATYADHELVVIVHAGYGLDQGGAFAAMADAEARTAGGTELELVMELAKAFNEDFVTDLRSRRALCQLMLGGVFDRHPGLRVMMTEIRADWVPATLGHLDAIYDEHRADLPAARRPSEYWDTNCLAGLSFMHRAEVEMRSEIGIDTMAFGRDYPHTEGTWPNTRDFLRLSFAGTPEADTRKLLGENMIRFFGLDGAHLARVAQRVGPDLADVVDARTTVDPVIEEHLDQRCGVAKPAEGDALVASLAALVDADVARLVAAR